MQSFSLIALTPAGLDDPAIAIAASRAGELGVLDLGCSRDVRSARAAIEQLTRFGTGRLGVRLSDAHPAFLSEVLSSLPDAFELVVLSSRDPERHGEVVRDLEADGRRVLLEVTDIVQARAGVEMGVSGLVAKGHEAGGWVGEETAFVLLQRLLSELSLPVWVLGGIGIHTAAACAAAGAAGVVLDAQLLLTRESGVGDAVRQALRSMDGSETICLGGELGVGFRAYGRTGSSKHVEELGRLATDLVGESLVPEESRVQFRAAVEARVEWTATGLWPIGQDAAFAEPLAAKHKTVAGVLASIREAIDEHLRIAMDLEPLNENSPLARSHRTRYPVVQGPMTRVSDRADFALSVAESGGLPFLALALMRASEVDQLLAETTEKLGELSWGVGILGFVPLELRQEQLEVIRRYRPPFALIAGGRPDQARGLEKDGTATYLHVPSPGLLELFLKDGARRFVFEGKECGGHVGPRSSFVLWNSMIDKLLDALPAGEEADCHVLFAGGIHGAASAAMVAAMAAPLSERGVRIGVLLGTAYLFTHEAVASGAIVKGFQEEAVRCERTVTLETGPGHSTRCADTAFAKAFRDEKRSLLRAGRSPEEIRDALEMLNIGRLRVASKGIDRDAASPERAYVAVAEADQRAKGMYMIGQVAALRNRTCSVEELHRDVSVEATRLVSSQRGQSRIVLLPEPEERPSAVAIIGMSCILPKAPDLDAYWSNILEKVDAITEIPKDRWDWELYFDSDPRAKDKIYSKWGGFLDEQPFDPVEFGMPPNSLKSIDPMQLLALKTARRALQDAGYWERPFDRSRASVILGASGGTGDLGAGYLLRSSLPLVLGDSATEVIERSNGQLPEWTEDSFAGLLLNVAAGRIANRFDFGGLNYVVDAACASSLAAVHHAVRELEARTTDMVLVGGVDTTQNPFGYLCFSKTHALSPTGKPRTFDAAADGIAISEGIVMLVLKRLEDAERDGDRVYAVIRATAGSSDGRAKGMTAPRPEGQMSALRRAYRKAGFSPKTVELFEAHGTGTVVGDRTEALALTTVLEEEGSARQSAAVGSVKSMIGHTKATAGVASIAKVALALYHRVLPATLGVTNPNPDARLDEGPLYVNSETRPWIANGGPRRAGASSFGFGGTNFHAVLEEHAADFLPARAASRRWPSELFLLAARSREELVARVDRLLVAARLSPAPALVDLAFTAWSESEKALGDSALFLRLAVVAASPEDLIEKLSAAREALDEGAKSIQDARGVYFVAEPERGKVAFLFPGQGSQYPNMLRDLAVHFPEVRELFEAADRALAGVYDRPLSRFAFPPPAFRDDEAREQQKALTQTNVAQPALGAADSAMGLLLEKLGLCPDMLGGHSYGEYVALAAAGAYDFETLERISEMRGRSIVEAGENDLGTMAAVDASAEKVASVVDRLEDVWLSNVNAPRQTILSGSRQGIEAAIGKLSAAGLRARSLPVACAFHSPIVAPARQKLAEFLTDIRIESPSKPVYSNVTAGLYPADTETIRRTLAEHLEKPVLFADQVRTMYGEGARVFVEVGPRNVLTGLVEQILEDVPHVSVPTDLPGRSGLTQLQHALGTVAANGVSVSLARLFEGRGACLVDPARRERLSPTTFLVNGSKVRPASEEPRTTKRPRVQVTFGENGAMPQGEASLPKPASVPASSPVVAAPAPAPRAVAREGRPDAGETMVEFQRIMSRFLDTQRAVMNAYLSGAADAPRTAASTPTLAAPEARAFEPAPVAEAPAGEPAADNVPEPNIPVSSAPPAEKAPEPAVASRERLEATLLEIVSERTGYPADMLGLDVDIEAELGIDSIKRVEILGTVQRACLPESSEAREDAMEALSGIKTLRGIVDWLEATVHSNGDGPEPPPPPSSSSRSPEAAKAEPETTPRVSLTRATVELVGAPAVGAAKLRADEGALLVTDDGLGVATELVELARERGVPAILVGDDVDLDSLDGVAAACARLGEAGTSIAGVAHLAPLGAAGDSNPARPARDVKAFFHLVRAAGSEIEERAAAGRPAWCVAALPVARDPGEEPEAVHPVHAALRGMAKTLALEWPGVRSASIELETGAASPRELAKRILAELAMPGESAAEIVYDGAERKTRAPRVAGLADTGAAIELGPDSVLLLTGGARGITAEVAVDLANRYKPTVVLWGRSPAPSEQESDATRGRTSPQELKAALIAEAEARGEDKTLPAIEARYRALLKEREIRRTLDRVRDAGARALYRAVDTRREGEVASALRACREELGTIDVVVHGAGLIEDKLVTQKSRESFDRVFDTKVEGALALAKGLANEDVKALVLFASAAGTFGNRGQFDYAGANEVLTELAQQLNRKWSGRVVSMAWGPWEKKGMVTGELRREFEKRGIELIPLDEGCRLFHEELVRGGRSAARVVFAGGAWGGAETTEVSTLGGAANAVPASWPLPLVRDAVLSNGGHVVRARRVFDPDKDLYLTDHRIDGVEVLPMAVATELMAEVAQQAWPEMTVIGVRELKLLKGVTLDRGPREVLVVARPQVEAAHERMGVDVHVEIRDAAGEGQPYYRATIELSDRPLSPPSYATPAVSGLPPFERGVDDAYRQWLFHGPLLQGITQIHGLGPQGVEATILPSPPSRCMKDGAGEWLIDPVVLDSGLQLFLLWARANVDKTPLPSRFTRLRRFAPIGDGPVRCYLRILETSRDPVFQIDIHFVGQDGRLLWALEEMEGVCTKALNRLGGSWLAQDAVLASRAAGT